MRKSIPVLFIAFAPLAAVAQVNDLCSSVTPDLLTVGNSLVWTGDNTGATMTDDYVPGSILAGVGVPSVWHAFTISTCSDITVEYCGTTPSFSEFWNALVTTCPANNTFVATQQYNTTACGDNNPTVYFLAVPPATYYYPVWTESPGGQGPYTITVTANACGGSGAPNDACASVTPEALEVGSTLTFTGDNSLASSAGDFAAGSPFAGAPVVWHAFTLDECTQVTVDYCSQDPVWNNTLGILSRDCPASDLVYFSTNNTTDCVDGNRTYVFASLAAGTYYMPVLLQPSGNAVGPYTITVTGEVCPPPPAYQDFCNQVQFQPIAVGGSLSFTGDNSSATPTGDFPVGSSFAGAPVIWHGITTTTCSNITVAYCGLDPVWGNTFGFLSRDCPAADLLYFSTFNTTDCVEGNRTYVYNNVAPGDYLIPVVYDLANNAVGPYTLQVSATSCPAVPPANDECDDVVAEALAAGATLTFTGDNTNATSNNDFIAGSPFIAAPVTWHAFTTEECADLVVSYCGQDPVWNNSLGILATACPGAGLVYFTTTPATCGDGNATYLFNDLQPGTYYLPVLRDAANGAIGPYSITATAEDCLFLGVPTVAPAQLAVWPNPGDGHLFISNVPQAGMLVQVLDITGRVLHSSRTNGTGTIELVLTNRLSVGTYLLVLGSDEYRFEQRYIVR